MKPAPELLAAGRVARAIHQEVGRLIRPGLNLLDIEALVRQRIKEAKMTPAFLGYKCYPAATCLSVNSVVVHAIPFDYQLQSGDVVSVDLGVTNKGWIVDTALTHPVGEVAPEAKKLLAVTNLALTEALKVVRAGAKVGDIGQAVQSVVERAGFWVIRELTGHGVGRELQMPPSIPNFGRSGTGTVLKEGMVLAIEPITATEPVQVTVDQDQWTVRATPDVPCAHFEHTVFVAQDKAIILTG